MRVGRFVINLTGAAGRQQHASARAPPPACRHPCRKRAPTQRPSSITQIDDAGVIVGRDPRQPRGAHPQHAANLAAGRIVRVQHAPRAVRAFHRQRRLAVRRAIELDAPRHQLADEARTVLDEHLHRASIAQAVAGGHGVGGMQLGRVARADGRRDAALRVTGVAFVRVRLW